VTPGDPTAAKPPPRQKPAAGSAKASGGGAAVSSKGTKEPRVSASKAGASKAGASGSRRVSRAPETEPVDDVLERLSRLEEAPAPSSDDAIVLPAIVEADPTDGADRPAAGSGPEIAFADAGAAPPAAVEVAGDLATGAPGGDGDGVAAPAVPIVASPVSAVSADLPTAAVTAAAVGTLVAPAEQVPVALAPALEPVPLAPIETAVPLAPAVPFGPAPAATEALGIPAADPDGTGAGTGPLRRLRPPVVFRRAKPRVRRVTRVVRHVDTWSVFKVALVFNVILYLVCLTAGVLLWNVAHATGTIDNIEQFFEQFGWESFEFKGGEIYHNAWIGGLFVAIGLTGFVVLVATLFNLITDLVGGLRVTVLEEEVVARPRQGADPTGNGPRP
jgi:hypothetical protein